MKKLLALMMVLAIMGWTIPKPMESIENYNVLMVHGAYGSDKGFRDWQYVFDRIYDSLPGHPSAKPKMYLSKMLDWVHDYDFQPAYDDQRFLGNATLGAYGSANRLTSWVSKVVLDEPSYGEEIDYVRNSYVYNWRSFGNPANSSNNNARELGDRKWNMLNFPFGEGGSGYRRALVEEAQEVKAVYDTLHGQAALEIIRQNPDLYRQLASRYILIGHSMGGVVSREYVQNSDYYHGDVDKIITLDSPHEGTGALNMQLRMVDGWETFGKTATQILMVAGAGGLALSFLGGSEVAMTALFLVAAGLTPSNFLVDLIVSLSLEHYDEKDPLVCYVDPHAKDREECADAANITDLEKAPYVADSMPMFRLLAGENSMTFTDPNLSWRNSVSWLVPEALTSAVVNVAKQVVGGGSGQVNNTNSITGLMLGLAGGINLQAHGSSLVETSNGLGKNITMLTDFNVDVKRATFNAAKHASEPGLSAFNYVLSGFEIAYIGMALIPYEPVKRAARASLVSVTALSMGEMFLTSTILGVQDLSESHMMPLYKKNLEDWYGEKNSFSPIKSGTSSYTPYLMEDFLYEKPFVNLALSDSRTMDSLEKLVPEVNDFEDVIAFLKAELSKEDSLKKVVYGNCQTAKDSSDADSVMTQKLFASRDSVLATKSSLTKFASQINGVLDSACLNNVSCLKSRLKEFVSARDVLNRNCYFESDSLQNAPLCEVGLYGVRDSICIVDSVVTVGSVSKHVYNTVNDKGDSVFADTLHIYGTFEQRDYSEFRNSPLKFKSESDWYKVGVKVDRWERVDGLKPNGDLAPKGVPIRHVERYNVPDIVVDGFIEKYSFVVDDLMPHRMRQIKMTFNSNEEVAWECDITKAEDDPHACAVYKRLLGNSWGNPDTTIGDKGYVPHPIKKNGRFDFNARKYFGNLANIQKDNQNTIMISMVNKIGLSNTQRFYYLFKATDNMLKPTWPQHDVVLNAIDGFGVYVSALDYQGFRVRSAKDGIFSDPLGTPTQVGDSLPMVMTLDSSGSSAVFTSMQKISAPAEGAYRWVVNAVVNNDSLDSSKTDGYEVHFTVDRTAPAFVLTSDAMMNPDSSMFITRFKWAGKDSADKANGSDIRAMLA